LDEEALETFDDWKVNLYHEVPDGYQFHLPTNVVLVAAYEDTQRLTIDTGKIGDETREVLGRVTRPEFRNEYIEAGCPNLDDAGRLSGVATARSLLRDDTDDLTEWASAYLEPIKDVRRLYTVELPFFDTDIEVGDEIKCRHERLDGRHVRAISQMGLAPSTPDQSRFRTVLTVE